MSNFPKFFRHVSKVRRPAANSRNVAVGVLVLAFAGIGFASLRASHAATFAVASEAESGTRLGNYAAGDLAGASGGASVKFGATNPTPPPPPPPPGGAPYVQPGTQGYRGSMADLTVYSAANGKIPPGLSCSWNQTYNFLNCSSADLTLDHAYVQGGIYWSGCGNMNLTNSVIDWQPSKTWHLIQAGCQNPAAGAKYTVMRSTLQTGPSVPTYTGGSDIGGINEYTGSVPMLVSNSLIQGFPQGLDPGGGSIIKDSEVYTQDAQCSSEVCHSDGLFSQGGNNILYQGNYISVQLKNPSTATAAIFFQSSPHSTGNKVIGNFLKGGAYSLYNETSDGLVVQDNTFGGATFGNATKCGGGSCGTFSEWTNNKTSAGAVVNVPTQ